MGVFRLNTLYLAIFNREINRYLFFYAVLVWGKNNQSNVLAGYWLLACQQESTPVNKYRLFLTSIENIKDLE
jgi:hypothetical protein